MTRPTTDRTRESLFNLLTSRLDLEETGVLDLFAGTGALGLEAISRGAAYATFVETNPLVIACARENASLLGVEDQVEFVCSDAVRFMRSYQGPAYDLVLADPPYELQALPDLPDLALPLVRPGGYFVLEHDRRHSFKDHEAMVTTRPYGRTIVTLFGR